MTLVELFIMGCDPIASTTVPFPRPALDYTYAAVDANNAYTDGKPWYGILRGM